MSDDKRILAFIETCGDPGKLKSLIANADARDASHVAAAARRRLFAVQAGSNAGSLEFDVWQSIHALEEALSTERGKTIRLARTRQKIARVGERRTVADLVTGPPSSGFEMLIVRGWPELTFEALVLKHVDETDLRDHATTRLAEAGVNVADLLVRMGRK